MDALNTGKVDGASVLIELAVKAREQGIDVRAAALGHKDGNVIIGGNGIEKVEDLRGKIFAIPHKQSTHNLLLQQMLAMLIFMLIGYILRKSGHLDQSGVFSACDRESRGIKRECVRCSLRYGQFQEPF